MIGEYNIENDIDTIKPGLGEQNVDESVTVNECKGILALSLSQMRHSLFQCYLHMLQEKLMCLHLQE